MLNWQKIFNLVKRTGDKLIVCDSATDSALVVMDLEKYEKLLAKAEWGGDDFGEAPAVEMAGMNEEVESEMASEEALTIGKKEEKGSDDLYYLEPVA